MRYQTHGQFSGRLGIDPSLTEAPDVGIEEVVRRIVSQRAQVAPRGDRLPIPPRRWGSPWSGLVPFRQGEFLPGGGPAVAFMHVFFTQAKWKGNPTAGMATRPKGAAAHGMKPAAPSAGFWYVYPEATAWENPAEGPVRFRVVWSSHLGLSPTEEWVADFEVPWPDLAVAPPELFVGLRDGAPPRQGDDGGQEKGKGGAGAVLPIALLGGLAYLVAQG